MALSRKRTHAVSEEQNAKTQASTPAQPKGIKTFAAVSKTKSANNVEKRRKTSHQREATPPAPKTMPVQRDTKRKRGLESVAEEGEDEAPVSKKDECPRLLAHGAKKGVQSSKRMRHALLPLLPKETPSKCAVAMFDRLRLDGASQPIPFALTKQPQAGLDTPPATPEAEQIDILPVELQELIQLHASFLTALSLYFAHNGTTSPVSLGLLLPQITRTWRKRTVTIVDLRKLLGFNLQTTEFNLQDCGRADICLFRAQPRGRALKRAASYIDEDSLNLRFEDAVRERWATWVNEMDMEDRQPATFLKQLPLAEIRRNESAEKAAPLFARGAQRLADLKAGQTAAAKAAPSAPSPVHEQQKSGAAVQNRGATLLDRILAKQAYTAGLPAAPTKAQLERRAALHRVVDIAQVLTLLSANKPRSSFTMPALVQQLQQSLRTPIGKEEATQVLEVMANEVTPGFVKVINSGMVKGVVVSRVGSVGVEELRERVTMAFEV
ncbi:hypothetical protein B0A50_08206 [Salinomyces thailandicus]|uniref:DNA replication factor Cdt1 C-terminal domain-containing protein n=1 Tax=Salinomyces thailandicus TaxID=706561 RepID=A0A4V5N374_9PEZI|nr:hypothetical protein B0A50_08206 [Salinomyces thailandica]